MRCNICGSPDHEATTLGCSRYQLPCLRPRTGWLCPVCHKGNAPDVKGCEHCAKQEPLDAKASFDAGFAGKISLRIVPSEEKVS